MLLENMKIAWRRVQNEVKVTANPSSNPTKTKRINIVIREMDGDGDMDGVLLLCCCRCADAVLTQHQPLPNFNPLLLLGKAHHQSSDITFLQIY
jgi:hypothetical protein